MSWSLLVPAIVSLMGVQNTVRAEHPKFSDFPAPTPAAGVLQRVDLSSDPKVNLFRTRLREAIGQPPDFAGFYRIVTWGSGTMAQTTAMIDVRDGRVIFAPFTSLLGVEYRANSRLLIENPPNEIQAYIKDSDQPKPSWLNTAYWVWEEPKRSFRQLTSVGK